MCTPADTNGGAFEQLCQVAIQKSPAIMLQGMAGSILGVWVAHGEGRVLPGSDELLNQIMQQDLAPVRCVDLELLPIASFWSYICLCVNTCTDARVHACARACVCFCQGLEGFLTVSSRS